MVHGADHGHLTGLKLFKFSLKVAVTEAEIEIFNIA